MPDARDVFFSIVALAAITITLGKVVASVTAPAPYQFSDTPATGLHTKP